MTSPTPRAAMQQALTALEMAQSGLQWYRAMHPEDVDGSDDEADEGIAAAIAALRASLSSLAAGEAEAAWADLPDQLRAHPGVKRLYRAASAPRGAAGEAKRGAAEEPLPPEVLVDALQDRVHDIGELKPCTRSRGGLRGAAGEGGERGEQK